VYKTLLVTCLALVLAACGGDGGTSPRNPDGPIALARGELRTIDPAARSLHIDGGPVGAEFVLIPSYASPSFVSGDVRVQLSGDHLADVIGPPAPSRLLPATNALLASTRTIPRDVRFALRLRGLERTRLAPRLPSARTTYALRQSASLMGASVPVVGNEMTLNTSLSDCGSPALRTARIVAITDHAVLAEDQSNPAGGFTASDYQSMAQDFETVIQPVLAENFGTPSDIDGNGGRIILFFTSAVNALNQPHSLSITTGFFLMRDLIPRSTSSPCPGSNQAELLYLAVPDPDGVINGNPLDVAAVRRYVQDDMAHEGASLTNAARRLYVTHAALEEPWLQEALGDIAEELVFYRASGLAPRQNLALTDLTRSNAALTAVNTYQTDNFLRLQYHLRAPEATSLTEGADFAEGGAAWQLLRYAADHSALSEHTLWSKLVDSPRSGVANLSDVFGVDFVTLERRWMIAKYTDDTGLPVGAEYDQPSWNYRSVMTAFDENGYYPLLARGILMGQPLSIDLRPGGASYVRFGVPSGDVGSIQLTASGQAADVAALVLTLIRTK
jgi:hypothetical protein